MTEKDITEVFETEYFYPIKLEKRLGKMEYKATEILNMFLSGIKWSLKRSDLNRLLRYVLLQMYRTPQMIDLYFDSITTDPLGLIKRDLDSLGIEYSKDGVKELVTIYLNHILDNDWNLLRKSKFHKIRLDALMLDRFWPFVVFSNNLFILNDNGFTFEVITGFDAPREGVEKALKDIFKTDFSGEQISSEMSIRKWINFILIPLTPRIALVLADDIWRLSSIHPGSVDILHDKGFLSDFVERVGITPIYAYKNKLLYEKSLHYSLDCLSHMFSNDDMITVFSNQITDMDAHYLNALTYNQKIKQCVFKESGPLITSFLQIKESHSFKDLKTSVE